MSRVPVAVNQKTRINILRLAFVGLLPAMLLVQPLSQSSQWVTETLEMLGIGCIIGAVLGRFWCVLYIGQRKNAMVIQDGPYSMVRHPLYVFSSLGVFGFGLMLGSVTLALLMTTVVGAILLMTARKEEDYLRQSFGTDYDDYARRVPMFVPNPWLFQTADNVTFSVATLRINLFDALVFLLSIPLAEGITALREQLGLHGIHVF